MINVKPPSTRNLSENGFSLVEVTVSAVIFTITTLGVMTLLASSRPANDIAFRETQAAYYAQSVLEDLRTKVDERTWDGGVDPLSIGQHVLQPVIYSGVTYTASYTVSEDLTIGPIHPRKVDVTVTW